MSTNLPDLQAQAQHEFNIALDFYWKAPNLIQYETDIELRKLTDYELAHPALYGRWALESQKLFRVFPFLIGTGSLFSTLALFESLLLQLAVLLETSGGLRLVDVHGHGAGRSLAYLRRRGVPTHDIVLWHQLQAALKIRHCFTHCSGFLAHSREAPELRRIIASQSYLKGDHRPKNPSDPMHAEYCVIIVGGPHEERLQLGIRYAWLATAYLRDYFDGLCEAAA